jgi:N-acetylmuramoyl-L-alanine amidase
VSGARLAALLLAVLVVTAISMRLVAAARAEQQLAAAALSLRGRVVAIDPGHGGIDPGAIGPGGVNEDTVVLAISLRLAEMLERAGAIAVLTRNGRSEVTGTTQGGPGTRRRINLRERVALINAAGADVVVSVHGNSFSSTSEHGAQVFYNPDRFPQNRQLAQLMQRQLARVTGETRRKVSEHIEHYILNYSNMPGVTVEVGFLSNPREAQLLADPGYQQRLAYAIYSALALWFARLPSATPPDALTPPGAGPSATVPSNPRPHRGRPR